MKKQLKMFFGFLMNMQAEQVQELWDRVQSRIQSKYRVRKTKTETVGLFAGILKCADCGSPLAYMRKKLKNMEKGVYRCSRYNNNGGKACTPHYIDEDDICTFVMNDIRKYATLATQEQKQLADQLLSSSKKSQSSESKLLQSKIREEENRLATIVSSLKGLYEDKLSGKLPESIFFTLMEDFSKEQEEIKNRLPHLHMELDSIREIAGEIDDWISLIGSHLNLEKLDRNTVTGLIEKVTVSERIKVDGENMQELEIEYRFIRELLLEEKKSNT